MTGETNLNLLISNMQPILNDGEYVFTSVLSTRKIPRELVVFEMREREGVTVVLKRKDAEALGLNYEYLASWITLDIHSSLEAVGLTAAFSNALAEHQISCNVIAGYYHDHIFVNKLDSEKAISVLKDLAAQSRR